MANTAYSQYEEIGLTPDILLYTTNYAARPVIVDDSGIELDEKGRRIVPAGTVLGGFMEKPNDVAEKVIIGGQKADLSTLFTDKDSNVTFRAKQGGPDGNKIKVSFVAAQANQVLGINVSGTTITVILATDASKVSTTTAQEIIDLIANDTAASALVDVKLSRQSRGTGYTEPFGPTALSGGAEEAPGKAEGMLRHPVDVTNGVATGTAVIAGFIDLDMLPEEPSGDIKKALPTLKFGRR